MSRSWRSLDDGFLTPAFISNIERIRERGQEAGSATGPLLLELVAARGGSSRSWRRFDLSKVDSGKPGETSGACLPTGRRRWRNESSRRRIRKEEGKKEREKERKKEEKAGEVTSLRSRVRRRASRCQIYRRVLDGACPRLLISPVASMLDAYRARVSIESISHEFPFLRRDSPLKERSIV